MIDLLNKLRNKIYLIIGRAILKAVNNDGKIQKVKVQGLYKENITDIDRIQEYGLETYPTVDDNSEVVILFPNGNRDNGVVVKIGNREYRPTDLSEGGVCLYNFAGTKVWLKADNTIKVEADAINMLAATESFLKGDTFDTWITGTLKSLYDVHTHTHPFGATGPPIVPLVAPSGHLSTKIKGE